MADEAFRIYVDQLRHGETEQISESLPPDFLDIHESELSFPEPVSVQGEAYLTSDDLMLRLNVTTVAYMPCSICNEKVAVGIKLKDFYHSELLADIKTGVYNFSEMLREAILLEVPYFTECNEGNCPHRAKVKDYLKEPKSIKEQEAEDGYRPFADLDKLDFKNDKKTKSS